MPTTQISLTVLYGSTVYRWDVSLGEGRKRGGYAPTLARAEANVAKAIAEG